MIAYDLDGTILFSRYNNPILKKIWFTINPNICKSEVENIITARTSDWAEITWLSCKLLGLNNVSTIIFNPIPRWDLKYIVAWKTTALENYNFDTYIDNDQLICDGIHSLGFRGVIKHV